MEVSSQLPIQPQSSNGTAFVSAICTTSEYTPVLGLNHDETALYPLELSMGPRKQHQMAVSMLMHVLLHQGFISKSKTTKAQDICFDTEQNVCHLKYIPKKPLKLYLPMLEKDVFV